MEVEEMPYVYSKFKKHIGGHSLATVRVHC